MVGLYLAIFLFPLLAPLTTANPLILSQNLTSPQNLTGPTTNFGDGESFFSCMVLPVTVRRHRIEKAQCIEAIDTFATAYAGDDRMALTLVEGQATAPNEISAPYVKINGDCRFTIQLGYSASARLEVHRDDIVFLGERYC